MSSSKRVLSGIQWPIVPNSKKDGDRSTTYANKEALKKAIGAVAPDEAAKVDAESNWRKNYNKYILRHVATSIETKNGAVTAAESGLKWMHDNFEFIRDETSMPLSKAMSSFPSTFKTGTIKGDRLKPSAAPPLTIPYKGVDLKGAALERQVRQWVQYGTIEPSAGDAIIDVLRNDSWRDLSDKYFVLLGASSAMGPLRLLLELGANVIAIDLDRPHIWKNLLALTRDSCGSVTFPLKEEMSALDSDEKIAASAGCNLLTQTPEILDWLRQTFPGKPLVVGAYAYLDGELHVRVSLAMDAIISGLISDKSSHPSVIPAYLCTPTDVHIRPHEAYLAAKTNYSPFSSYFAAWMRLSPLYWFGPLQPNFGDKYIVRGQGSLGYDIDYYLVDGLINRQGPNYALAKRMQHWRAVISRECNKCTVSSNVAPSTATASVTHNRLFAMAYGGMHWFKPMEVFQQETSNAVMGTLLLRDISDEKAKGASSLVPLGNPLEIFSHGAFHGGVWRIGFKMDSIGEVSILMYLLIRVLKLMFLCVAAYAIFNAVSKNTGPEI